MMSTKFCVGDLALNIQKNYRQVRVIGVNLTEPTYFNSLLLGVLAEIGVTLIEFALTTRA
ncbi:MAG: hypothetical protein H7235_10090 [Bdellovibrionaceae bacterium]|nr:hypothetical protein [Pseudobdellovibrionaceae bacterium]